ncbi:DUF2332 domain-containing protein [Roseateles amylovorans]|uniref:DUF2332 domain-containing protein n=1 Tax=Roseateles amylovorans TaxID=2978473 RepID=A0ABY6B3W7_9BURK|nr:DUF2332 domain-containing protein [Roseateles amylovorans]UXH78664.1 DUF2332 domain-containing protein [Roseateles amylovorans]
MAVDAVDRETLLKALAHRFTRFAEIDGRDDPLYVALATAIASDVALTALLAEAPATQHLPVLLLAALHDRVLAGTAHPLAAYYASVGGTRAPDAELPALLKDFVGRESSALLTLLRTRTTQTNEIGRCAVLRPALQALAVRLGGRPEAPSALALFDFGCSAGLNLGVDRYAYDDGIAPVEGDASGDVAPPVIRSEWRGAPPQSLPGPRAWTVSHRHGVDLFPIDPADEAATRWLRACLWPGDAARRARLDGALALARRYPAPLVRSDDGLTVLERWLDTLPSGVQPVLFNVWVLAYFDPEGWRRHLDRIERLVRARGLAWISGEMGKLAPLSDVPASPPGESPHSATLWTLQWRSPAGLRTEALAWSHPHGRWIEWLDRPAA